MQKFMMCSPAHYGAEYDINPFALKIDHKLAVEQWGKLLEVMCGYGEVVVTPSVQGLYSMAFCASAGFVINDEVSLSQFMDQPRQSETMVFLMWFEANGIKPWFSISRFEGASDALWDEHRQLAWCGYNWRSEQASANELSRLHGIEVQPLKLIDPRYYHLDTCFCPLETGHVIYFPAAFDEESQAVIKKRVESRHCIEVYAHEARVLSCNGVEVADRYIAHKISDGLQRRLRSAGYAPVEVDVGEFTKSGSGVKSLTLRLDYHKRRWE